MLQVFGPSATNGGGPDAIVLWQLIGAGVSMILAPAAYSLKVKQWVTLCEWGGGGGACQECFGDKRIGAGARADCTVRMQTLF
jgi:hypothetical protein